MKIIYQVMNEGTDGLDSSPMGLFETEEEAKKAAIGQGPSGYGEGRIYKLELFESFADYKENNKDARRAKALSKLTDEDRKVLGLR